MWGCVVSLYAQQRIVDLQANYQTELLGTDAEEILFSWRIEDPDHNIGLYQERYQIEVTSELGQVVWSSGWVDSDRSLAIPYRGEALQPTMKYHWRVTIETNEGKKLQNESWFETGLMDSSYTPWHGAQWIGGSDDDMVLYSDYLSVFALSYELSIAEGSDRAAIVYGANDDRLMDPNLNILNVANAQDESYVAIELDIRGLDRGGVAQIHVYRVGYTPTDQADMPYRSYDIAQSIIDSENAHAAHQIVIESVFGSTEIYVGGHESKHKVTTLDDGAGFGAKGTNLNPSGRGGDFISYPMLSEIGYMMGAGQTAAFSALEVKNYRKPGNVIFSEKHPEEESIFSDDVEIVDGAYIVSGGSSGKIITRDPSKNGVPMLRNTFDVSQNKEIKKARIYATARGIYELYLNGYRVGVDYFNPGLTQYNKTHMYQTYDVTDLIKKGKNAWGAMLGEGWWSGNATFKGEHWNFFGDRQSLLAQLVIDYEDGTQDIVSTQPESWKFYNDGPIKVGSFFQGEVYDAGAEESIDGWSTSSYDDSSWSTAVSVGLEGTSITDFYTNFLGLPMSLDYDDFSLIGQIGGNVQVVDTLTAISVSEVRPRVFVYDMGQNMVGVPSIPLMDVDEGDQIRLRYAEVLYPDLPEYGANVGMIMLENIRAALAQDLYIAKGANDLISPSFTFHGYRYLEITGIDAALPIEDVRGLVISSVKGLASSYECSNELVNKLWENITWSLKGNFLSIPTDCPQRNERMGWNGDISVFAKASTWLANMNPFLYRHTIAMRDMQSEAGRFSDVAPVGNGFGGTLWGSAGLTVPWQAYQQYGDINLLREHYPAMRKYVDFLISKIDKNGILKEGPLGDWLSSENAQNDNSQLWKAYLIYDLEILCKSALYLGNQDDHEKYLRLYEKHKADFNEYYFDEQTGESIHSGVALPIFGPPASQGPSRGDVIGTQASYAVPLALGAISESQEGVITQHLVNSIQNEKKDDQGIKRPAYSLMTGFIGTASIGDALSEHGAHETAYRLLQQETYPSWLYPVKNGATSIWERLNSYTIENGFGGNNSMNSFNHYAFGAVASWMYNYSLGIQRDEEHPGFKQFVLAPVPDPTGKMSYATGYYDSMYGRISSSWDTRTVVDRYEITVPANTTATLQLIATESKDIRINGKKVKKAKGVSYIGRSGEVEIMNIQSGQYQITVEK